MGTISKSRANNKGRKIHCFKCGRQAYADEKTGQPVAHNRVLRSRGGANFGKRDGGACK